MKTINKTIRTLLLFSAFLFFTNNVLATDVPTDKEITNAVYREMMLNATTPAYMIDVETSSGIVTLTGSVNNILARDRSVKIARTVRGVRAVINQIEVIAGYRSDANVQIDVRTALLNDPATDLYEIKVDVKDAEVTLSGTVDSWQEKQLSEFVAKGVKGVKSVKNDIIVSYSIIRPDNEIKNDIEQSLKNDVRIDNALIKVKVNKGNVKLSGIVGSASEKSLAYSNAWTSGVKSVETKDLSVKEWARNEDLRKDKYVERTDLQIKVAVEDAFLYDPRVLSFNPEVSVRYGVVTLTGVVDNLKAKRAAAQDAKNVVGVFRVKNYLKVRPAFIPEDNTLETNLENALFKSPTVSKWKIDVTADNGVVYLNGTVDSYFEKSQAEDIASKTKGVVAVENNLRVFDNNDYYYYNYYGWNSYLPLYQIDIGSDYKPDSEIKEDIASELWWSPYVNRNEVKISVSDGEATLEGTVDTKREKLYAEINALEGGATKVVNNLVVNNAY